MELYDETAFKCSKIITNQYSTSFSLGIKLLNNEYRSAIYGIYAYVRYADEIVDTFHTSNKSKLLHEFKTQTFDSIFNEISLNPVLHAYQFVINKYQIPSELTEAFLKSMEMDLETKNYDSEISYNEYIYGSAEVVGLMCLKVFCDGSEMKYLELKPYAQSLGAAFQKINFLRDIKSDFDDRGRVYFPGVSFQKFDEKTKKLIEESIKIDFDHALIGILKLPLGSRLGVYVAYIYYFRLYRKIVKKSSEEILETRIRIPNSEKIWLLVQAYCKFQLKMI